MLFSVEKFPLKMFSFDVVHNILFFPYHTGDFLFNFLRSCRIAFTVVQVSIALKQVPIIFKYFLNCLLNSKNCAFN